MPSHCVVTVPTLRSTAHTREMTEPDLDRLAERLAVAGVSDVRPMEGGASSLTYGGRLGGRRVVVKVAPPGVMPLLNRDVLRQARLIRALEPTPVPVPEVALGGRRACRRRSRRCS